MISKYTNLFQVHKDCFNYTKITKNDKAYYTYDLKKNCFAFEHKGTTPSYKVYTDSNGLRVEKNKKTRSKNKVIFLGDSFTYGFGVNYENSLPGLISKKTKNEYDVLNFGVPGYSPSKNYYNLKKFLKNNENIKISKVFYILDLTDVHDEANRWEGMLDGDIPVIADKTIEKEIKKTFDYKNKFRTIRFISYYLNNNLRNIRKNIKNFTNQNEQENFNQSPTFWGSFTHTSSKELKDNDNYIKLWNNDYLYGLNKIKVKIKEISQLINDYNAEFYIAVHPWIETLELGQEEFDWENYAAEVCEYSNCKKLINFFKVINKLKKENSTWQTQVYFKKDLHFNKLGNSLYADLVYQEAFNND